jgi:hypothetical protein
VRTPPDRFFYLAALLPFISAAQTQSDPSTLQYGRFHCRRYLDAARQFEWVKAEDVQDFRLARPRHLHAAMSDPSTAAALKLADATLADWIHSSVTHTRPSSQLSGEDPIPLSPREPLLAYRTTSGTSLAETDTETETETETVAMQTTTELRVTSDGETHTAVRWRPTGGATHSTLPEDETDSAVASEEEATDQASDHDLGAADGDVAAVLRDAARELLAQFAQRVQQSLAAADSVEERQRESQRHRDTVAVGGSKRKQGGGGARWTPSSEVPSYR